MLIFDSDISVASDDEDSEFISIKLTDTGLVDKRINNKMRRKFAGRCRKFEQIIKVSRELEIAEKVAASIMMANKDQDPDYIGGCDGEFD